MRELRIGVDGAELAVSYTPSGPTAIVALHGASAGTRAHPLYEHLHAVLPPAGIGVATFDRRGEGESSGSPSVGHFGLQAADALAVARALGASRVGLWGFSQGGWVAPLAATLSDRVAFLALVASTGVSPAEQMRYAAAEQMRRAGFGPDAVVRAVGLWRAVESWIRDPDDEAGSLLRAQLDAARHEPWWPLAFLQAELPDAAGRAAWRAEMEFDPAPIFARVTAPVLLFYGASDEWTPVEASTAAWRRARGDQVEIHVIPGAAHDLSLADGSVPGTYADRLVAWCVAHAAG